MKLPRWMRRRRQGRTIDDPEKDRALDHLDELAARVGAVQEREKLQEIRRGRRQHHPSH